MTTETTQANVASAPAKKVGARKARSATKGTKGKAATKKSAKGTKKTPAKKTPAKKSTKGKAAKGKAATTERKRTTYAGLSKAQHRALSVLKDTTPTKGMTRAELAEATGVEKGWSRILGAATKDGMGKAGDNALMSQGYVDAHKPEAQEGQRSALHYYITKDGKKKLAEADKAAKADSK